MSRLIDADKLKEHYSWWAASEEGKEVKRIFDEIVDLQPTVEKHGHWIVILAEEWCTFDECKCSVCGAVEYFNKGWKKFNHCPNCGAKMEVEEE